MEKVRPWCGQPSDRGRLKNRTEPMGKRSNKLIEILFVEIDSRESTNVLDDGVLWRHQAATRRCGLSLPLLQHLAKAYLVSGTSEKYCDLRVCLPVRLCLSG